MIKIPRGPDLDSIWIRLGPIWVRSGFDGPHPDSMGPIWIRSGLDWSDLDSIGSDLDTIWVRHITGPKIEFNFVVGLAPSTFAKRSSNRTPKRKLAPSTLAKRSSNRTPKRKLAIADAKFAMAKPKFAIAEPKVRVGRHADVLPIGLLWISGGSRWIAPFL